VAHAPEGVDSERVAFEQGDAMELRAALGVFDVVLMANLIDRLREPHRCLARLPALVKPGGQLVITSPYTWLEEFTPHSNWLGGFERDGRRVSTHEGLQAALGTEFDLVAVKDLPFLIREHARKYQWSVAEATIWRRKSD
jgi:SAM-dependent methyltransferase